MSELTLREEMEVEKRRLLQLAARALDEGEDRAELLLSSAASLIDLLDNPNLLEFGEEDWLPGVPAIESDFDLSELPY
jgi:hypothetical protein